MNGSPSSRYTAEEELTLGVGSALPPSNPFATSNTVNNNDVSSFDSDEEYVNGDDAYPEYGETSSSSTKSKKSKRITELWKDDIRSIKNSRKGGRIGSITTGGGGQSFEMVPLSDNDKEDDDELGEFDYDNEDDENDVHVRRRTRQGRSQQQLADGACTGDDYTTSNTYLPKSIYQYLYPPNVPRDVQLMRPENIAVPACYLLVGLLQGLSGPFTNVYPLDLNASEAQQVRSRSFEIMYALDNMFCFLSSISTTNLLSPLH